MKKTVLLAVGIWMLPFAGVFAADEPPVKEPNREPEPNKSPAPAVAEVEAGQNRGSWV